MARKFGSAPYKEPPKPNSSAFLRRRLVTARVKPGSRLPSITEQDGVLIVAVREPARDGEANDAVRRALAAHFGVAVSRVELVRGAGARTKTFRIEGIA